MRTFLIVCVLLVTTMAPALAPEAAAAGESPCYAVRPGGDPPVEPVDCNANAVARVTG